MTPVRVRGGVRLQLGFNTRSLPQPYGMHTGYANSSITSYCGIAAILLWTDEPNERTSLYTSRVPTRAEAPRNLTLYDGPVPRQYQHSTNAVTHHLL
jgi:hypothetical protein